MKFLATFCLIASLATVAFAGSSSWGKRVPQDKMLYRENVVRTPINGHVWNVNVVFPKSGQTNSRTISVVYVYDQFKNSSGAMPTISSGGHNYKFTTVNLKGQFSRGMNSTVEIYGK